MEEINNDGSGAKLWNSSKTYTREVVFDHNDQIFDYIKKGVIGAAISFEPFNQGYEPIILMYNHLVTGQPFEASRITCKSNIVTEENVDNFV